MKDWKDKALEDSFPKETDEQRIKRAEKRFFGFLLILLCAAAIAAFIYLICFAGIPFPSFELKTWLIIGIVAVCIQLERIIRLMPR